MQDIYIFRPLEEGMELENDDEPHIAVPHSMMRPDPLQLEDVVINIEHRTGLMDRGPKIDISVIILSCVQTALSMVKDKEGDADRTTKRVALVLELLQRQTGHGKTCTFFLVKKAARKMRII